MTRVVMLLVAWVFALSAVPWAQGKTDFSGAWTFQADKSDKAPAGGAAVLFAAALTLIDVKQSPTQLVLAGEATYSLDGRESVNRVYGGQSKTKANWDGSKLVLTSVVSVSGGGVGNDADSTKRDVPMTDIWSLDAGGIVLTIERSFTAPAGPITRKLVYVKTRIIQ